MRKILFLIVIFTATAAFTQNGADTLKPWKVSGIGSLTINQASFSNWSPGGENSLSATAFLKFYADYTRDKFSFNNTVNLKYGMINSESESLKKNEDLIELISQYNHNLSKHWSASALVNFNTQFANGYNYPDDSTVISTFMAPAYLTIAPGVLYKPVDYFSILFAPISMRSIIVMDQDLADIGAFGVDKADTLSDGSIDRGTGKNSKFKLGTFVEFYFKKEIKTDLAIESKLNLFYNYLQDNNIPNGVNPVDFNWETFINYKISKWFSANLFVHLAYMPGDVFIERGNDLNGNTITVSPNDKLQIKQSFGIGLAYNF